MNELGLEEWNPSLWRCMQAQRIIMGPGEPPGETWWDKPLFHMNPCKSALTFTPDYPNLIIWNGAMHHPVLQFKPDVFPLEAPPTLGGSPLLSAIQDAGPVS